ncbi:MAG: ABC transporter permease [Sphaerochaeta sp.]|nr:ABC transporter permease [Sphaerochaeta sp.]
MNGLVHRNLLVFFRDRATVFFSLLAVLIVIGLYVLFLGDAWVGNMADIPHVRTLMDTWIMAGLLSVASITTTMGAFDTMVEDKAKKIEKDIIFSPLKRSSIVGGYVISSFVIGVIMSLATLVLAELYIVLRGGAFLSGVALVQTLGLILFSTLSNTVFLFFLVSCFSSPNAFSTASSIIGTLIGFLTGIYLPIGTASSRDPVGGQAVPAIPFGGPVPSGDAEGSDGRFVCWRPRGCGPLLQGVHGGGVPLRWPRDGSGRKPDHPRLFLCGVPCPLGDQSVTGEDALRTKEMAPEPGAIIPLEEMCQPLTRLGNSMLIDGMYEISSNVMIMQR